MNCNHENNHCHECQKAENMNVFYAIVSIIGAIFMIYVSGWRTFIDFWPFWLVVAILAFSGLVVWWDNKKKREQKEKQEREQKKLTKQSELEKNWWKYKRKQRI